MGDFVVPRPVERPTGVTNLIKGSATDAAVITVARDLRSGHCCDGFVIAANAG